MPDAERRRRVRSITFVLPLAAVLVAACERGAAPPAGPPALQLERATVDLGVMAETETRVATVAFTNTGGEPLHIEDVKTSCGCTVATLDRRELPPGDSGTVAVTFKPSAPGLRQKQYVNIISNAAEPLARVMIIADVTAFLEIKPRMLKLGRVQLGEPHRVEVRVSCIDPDFELLSVRSTNPKVVPTVRPADGEADGRIVDVLIPPDASWGPIVGWLELTARGRPAPGAAPITHPARMRVMGQVFGRLDAEPDTFRFGVKPGEAFERTVELMRPSDEPFEVLEVTVDAPALAAATVRADRVGSNAWHLVLSATGGDVDGETVMGSVVVRTDVAGEERLEVPVVGVVQTTPGGVR